MAAGDHRSRLRCLTLARIVAASLVALAFTVTMVVVLLRAGVVDLRLSVKHGHIQSAGLLWNKSDLIFKHVWRRRSDTITFYTPAKELTVWMSMDAYDTSLRATNVCVTAVHIIDMPNAPSFEDMVEIHTVNNTVATGNDHKACKKWRHPGSPSMQLDRWVTLQDPLMLCYISQKYGGVNDFTAMLKVNITIFFRPEDGIDTPPLTEIHYCWPVTIGNTRRISQESEAVACKPSHAIDYASIAPVLNLSHLTATQQYICRKWGNLPLA